MAALLPHMVVNGELVAVLVPARAHNPKSISTGSCVFAGLTTVTDRPRYLVCNNRPHPSTAMHHNNEWTK